MDLDLTGGFSGITDSSPKQQNLTVIEASALREPPFVCLCYLLGKQSNNLDSGQKTNRSSTTIYLDVSGDRRDALRQ